MVGCSATAVVSYWISTSNHNIRVDSWKLHLVVSYWISTSNHNTSATLSPIASLYLIEFLHQTTTRRWQALRQSGCILLNFYIKPQPKRSFRLPFMCCILLNFYIKPQLSFAFPIVSIVVSYWISTSNHNISERDWQAAQLYLIEFLHQTTTAQQSASVPDRCILLNFYIKPQLWTVAV